MENSCEAVGQALGDKFPEAMNEAYRPKVSDHLRLIFLSEQDEMSIVDMVQASEILCPERVERVDDIRLDVRPRHLIEKPSEPIGSRGFLIW